MKLKPPAAQDICLKAALVMAAFLVIPSAQAAITFIQWTSAQGGNDHYYGVTESRLNWTAAESLAVGLGGHLASITSQAEQNFLINTFVVSPDDRRPLWIGLRDINFTTSTNIASRNFQWTTGEVYDYATSFNAWNPGEPNNYTQNEFYTAFNFHYGVNQSSIKGTWNDTTLTGSVTPSPYFALVELNSVPEPSVMSFIGLGLVAFIVRRRR